MKKLCFVLALLLLSSSFTLTSCSDNTSDGDLQSDAVTDETAEVAPDSNTEVEEAEQTTTDIIKEKYAGTDLNGF